MPTNHTYTFTLGQVNGKWIKPIDLEVDMGDIVRWQIPANPLTEFKITGERNPFESLRTGVFATYVGGRISENASGNDWKYTLEYKFNNAHFIIDPKIKVKPKPGPGPNWTIALVIGTIALIALITIRIRNFFINKAVNEKMK